MYYVVLPEMKTRGDHCTISHAEQVNKGIMYVEHSHSMHTMFSLLKPHDLIEFPFCSSRTNDLEDLKVLTRFEKRIKHCTIL